MESADPRMPTWAKVCWCYALGFLSAPHVKLLVGTPIAAMATAMSVSSLLALAFVLTDRRRARKNVAGPGE